MLKKIKIKFQNGITYESALREILVELRDDFIFQESTDPDFILFGPYGNDLPPKGDYVRVAYYCENIKPDMSICEWAFGVPKESEIQHPKYKRIQWHNLNPQSLIKGYLNTDTILNSKTKFCNYLYSHQVDYRDKFFKQLAKYKKIDSPGKCMNNMPSIDKNSGDHFSKVKHEFLSQYKFTIAFENYSYPGYQTEKLYDAMQANSIPIYCGDPQIDEIFNTKSFLNSFEILNSNYDKFVRILEKEAQMNFVDIRPQFYKTLYHRFNRKIKAYGRGLKMRLEYNNFNYKKLVDKIIELDENDDLYMKMLKEPWLKNNTPEAKYSSVHRWKEIFNNVNTVI